MMFLPPMPYVNDQRRDGVVLLVVIALLALFASVGLSFVFYAESEATAARLTLQSGTMTQLDADPELLISHFLGQFIYDTKDVTSALRGHGLAPNAYGYNFQTLGGNIQAVSGGSPIVVTSTGHGLGTGFTVTISGVGGIPTANGTFTITYLDANNFFLNGTADFGTYTSGGTWTGQLPSGYTLASPTGNITDASNSSPIVITSPAHGLADGTQITIPRAGTPAILGNTAANGTWYVKFINGGQFSLYSDPLLTLPSTGNSAFIPPAAGTTAPAWVAPNLLIPTLMNFTAHNGVGRLHLPKTTPVSLTGKVAGAISGSPITINSLAHGLNSGDSVIISGLNGIPAANGTFIAAVIDANNFSLNGSNGLGIYTGGGTWISVDTYNLTNYSYFPAHGFLRDPERVGNRVDQLSPVLSPYAAGNVPWTYGDLHNNYLGMMSSDGEILLPSYHRAWTGTDINSPTPFNPLTSDWSMPYRTLSPHPWLHPNFIIPDADGGGHVRNVDNAKGTKNPFGGYFNNDSYWMYTGFPIRIGPDGKKYTVLFAPFICDLDGKMNVNVAGSPYGSNQGWGPWEVNLAQVLNGNATEWQNIFMGTNLGSVFVPGRYATTSIGNPGAPLMPAGALGWTYWSFGKLPQTATPGAAGGFPGLLAHTYAQVNYNGSSTPFTLPFGANSFPTFPAAWENGSALERDKHPALYNFRVPVAGNKAFNTAHMEALLRYQATGSTALTSDLFRLCPKSFANLRTCWQLTTDSYDWNRPAVAPWIWDRRVAAGNNYGINLINDVIPSGSALGFPSFAQYTGPMNATAGNTEFGPDLTRPGYSSLAASLIDPLGRFNSLTRHNLNQFLPPYPHMGSSRDPATNDKSGPITDATNASPITITSKGHGLAGGEQIVIGTFFPVTATNAAGALVNSTANGTRYAKVIDADRFSLYSDAALMTPIAGNGNYAGGGLWTWNYAAGNYNNAANYSNKPVQDNTPADCKRFDFHPAIPQFIIAQQTRQTLAANIYNDLLRVTEIDTTAPAAQRTPAQRWLAQLAVNIVDFIDEDDIPTPSTAIAGIYGTELPRVVLNEVMAQYQLPGASGAFPVRVWAELFNPLPTSAGSNTQPLDTTAVPLYVSGVLSSGVIPFAPYQLVLAQSGGVITAATNTSPIKIYSQAHGLTTGMRVVIANIKGNTNANNTAGNPTWPITVTNRNGNINNATNTNPIVITTAAAHGLDTGAGVTISGVVGNTAANGFWTINRLSATQFSLNGSAGNGAYPKKAVADTWSSQSFTLNGSTGTVGGITDASNTAPIVILTSAAHALASGDKVNITGILGNTNANGVWTIKVLTPTTFELNGSTPSGAYVSGGSWNTPGYWTTTDGLRPAVNVNNNFLGDPLVTGLTTATGIPRLKTDGDLLTSPPYVPNDFSICQNFSGAANFSSLSPGEFLIVGPKPATDPDANNTISLPRVPAATKWVQSDNMKYAANYNSVTSTMNISGSPILDPTKGITVMLRRLVNPYLPFNATSNPYMTIDHLEQVPLSDMTDPVNGTSIARGKLQPYASYLDPVAANSQVVNQATATNTLHTFGKQNIPIASNFDWLVHLDRQLISPMELLQVSGFKPHQLTHKFIVGPNATDKFKHRVDWFDQNSLPGQSNRLYRLFEYLETHDRTAELAAANPALTTGVGRRMFGKVNINTCPGRFDPIQNLYISETFRGIAAPAAGGSFTVADVDAIFDRLHKSRMPGVGGLPSALDRPFQGMGTGHSLGDIQYPTGMGINNTLFRNDGTGSGNRLFQLTGASTGNHPYKEFELLTKVFNNVTTRSNVFAVWMTSGFFEVTDGPVTTVTGMTATPGLANVTVSALNGTIGNVPWKIAPGMHLWVDGEPVVVQAITAANSFSANFINAHPGAVGKDVVMKCVLGAEVGRAENRQVRHRMFAVVDRSNVAFPTKACKLLDNIPAYTATAATPFPWAGWVMVDKLSGVTSLPGDPNPANTVPPPPAMNVNYNWKIEKNMTLNLVGYINGLVTDATNAAPIAINSLNHGLANGNTVIISGVTGNTNANGTFAVTVIDANNFSLNGTTGNGPYAGGGIWSTTASVTDSAKVIDVDATVSPPKILIHLTGRKDAGGNYTNRGRGPGDYFSLTTGGPAGPTIGREPTSLGNPGPQPLFDVRKHSTVVPYFSIIQ